ncbi:LysR family transcriptional regulator [Methylobacterium oryzihabitans]|uniref:LysR family transcriptional regulator n=1 Tax=Methylobacterium oryzihabitans TaxID=2499852 RepID=A0A3S2XQJ0_9HYPH|nr:LysR family transcriptional regulator [Methylobacterium oryzihabitans]RVU20551.1 LysR family transcriptional regulator [Methylobacterium oryzihabitans]
MQTTSLRYFLAVARTGSIARASEQLNVAASAISRQIANLEAELDCVLFERRPRGMVASPAGELLARHARATLRGAEQVATEIHELRGLARGFVRIACTEGFALDLLPNAIAAFHRVHPGIRFELAVEAPATVTRLVAEGEVDLGVTFALGRPPAGAEAVVRVLYESVVAMVAVSAPDHPLAGREVLFLSDLASYPLALVTSDTTLRRVFDAACHEEGLAVEPVLTANRLAALFPFVRGSRGLAVMSALSVTTPLRHGELAAIPLRARMRLDRDIQVQTMRERRLPHACRAFVGYLTSALSAGL